MKPVITSYCRIKDQNIFVNGNKIILTEQESPSGFFSEAYKHFEINYPKFHKMDNLSKLGFVAVEAALRDSGFLQRNLPETTAIIMANKASSLDTDRLYQNSINDKNRYLPSPATFVYTLPNIVIGEIAIKHKITGENSFFVCDSFDAQLLVNQAQIAIAQMQATALICGWVNYDNGKSDALIYLVEMSPDSIKNINFNPLNEETLNQFYK